MKCARCETSIPEGEEQEHLGRMLCEDCYMEKVRGELRGGKKYIRLW